MKNATVIMVYGAHLADYGIYLELQERVPVLDVLRDAAVHAQLAAGHGRAQRQLVEQLQFQILNSRRNFVTNKSLYTK